MSIVLPYPISANRYWISFYAAKLKRVIIGPTKKATLHKKAIAKAAQEQGLQMIEDGPLVLRMVLIPKNRVCMDLDNALKVTIDALQGVAFRNDSQIWRIEAERRHADEKGPRVELEVEALAVTEESGQT